MNKKILIGSIIAVIVLIGVSFTSVVGYNSVTSDIKASPLFTVRSSRAIDKESKDLTCDYVGKGNTLLIPKRDSKTALIQKFIDSISKMDDATFKGFLNLIISQIQKNNEQKDVKINEVITTIHQIRDNPETIVSDYSDKNSDFTWGGVFLSTVCWFPGCYIFSVILILLYVLLGIPLTCSLGDCPTL